MKSPAEIWRLMREDERRQAAHAFLKTEGASVADERLAGVMKFRVKTVEKMPLVEKALRLSQRAGDERLRQFIPGMLSDFHLQVRLPLICAFLDAQDIAHAEGQVESDEPPSLDSLRRGLEAIQKSHPPRDIALYFLSAFAVGSAQYWQHLPKLVEESGIEDHLRAPEETSETEPTTGAVTEEIDETSEGFTTIDDLIIRTIVAAATGQEGALDLRGLVDLVEDYVGLNANRHRTYFHLGYLHALFEQPFTFNFSGENLARRIWYLAGVLLGLLRGDRSTHCMQVIRQEAELFEDLARDRSTSAGGMVAVHVYPLLVKQGEFARARLLIAHQLPRLPLRKRRRLQLLAFEDGANLVREGNAAEALLALEILDRQLDRELLGEPDNAFDLEFLRNRLHRKIGQAHQMQGNFKIAREILEPLAESEHFKESVEALADLGLIAAGVRALGDLCPTVRGEDDAQRLVATIERGRAFFRRSIERDPVNSTNASFALGVLEVVNGSSDADLAVEHLERALTGMLRREAYYRKAGVLDWTKFLLGISLLELLQETRVKAGSGYIQDALASPVFFPISLWRRCLDAVEMHGDVGLLATIAERIEEKRGSKIYDLFKQSRVLDQQLEIRSRYAGWVGKQRWPASLRWDEWSHLLRISSRDGSKVAAQALDQLEGLALEHCEFADRYADLMEDTDLWSSAWDAGDVEQSLRGVFETHGKLFEAARTLDRAFWRLTAAGSHWELEDAESVLEEIKCLNLAGWNHTPHESRLRELKLRSEETNGNGAMDRLREGLELRILFCGGNETQVRNQKPIADSIAAEFPGVRVDFMATGWESNWSKYRDTIVAALPNYDGLVLIYLVRTGLGRALRAACDDEHPWFSCSGKGRGAMERSIRAACRVLAERKAER